MDEKAEEGRAMDAFFARKLLRKAPNPAGDTRVSDERRNGGWEASEKNPLEKCKTDSFLAIGLRWGCLPALNFSIVGRGRLFFALRSDLVTGRPVASFFRIVGSDSPQSILGWSRLFPPCIKRRVASINDVHNEEKVSTK